MNGNNVLIELSGDAVNLLEDLQDRLGVTKAEIIAAALNVYEMKTAERERQQKEAMLVEPDKSNMMWK